MIKKLKLIELTDAPWEKRWQPLAQILKTECGVDFTWEIVPVDHQTLKEKVFAALSSDADLCRVGDAYCAEVLKFLPQTTYSANFAGAAPYLVKEKGGWWPRSVLDDALSRSISTHLGQVDIASYAFVAGAGDITRLVCAAIVKAGFSTVNITDRDEERLRLLVEEMRRKYFQVTFNAIPFEAITTLPGIHSLVINTTPLSLDNELLDELYFFNFLKAGGAVIDMTLVPANTPLMMEAEHWGARHLSGDYIACERDGLMIERLLHQTIPVEKYRQLLRAEIDAAPFDPGPFLERFRNRGTSN